MWAWLLPAAWAFQFGSWFRSHHDGWQETTERTRLKRFYSVRIWWSCTYLKICLHINLEQRLLRGMEWPWHQPRERKCLKSLIMSTKRLRKPWTTLTCSNLHTLSELGKTDPSLSSSWSSWWTFPAASFSAHGARCASVTTHWAFQPPAWVAISWWTACTVIWSGLRQSSCSITPPMAWVDVGPCVARWVSWAWPAPFLPSSPNLTPLSSSLSTWLVDWRTLIFHSSFLLFSFCINRQSSGGYWLPHGVLGHLRNVPYQPEGPGLGLLLHVFQDFRLFSLFPREAFCLLATLADVGVGFASPVGLLPDPTADGNFWGRLAAKHEGRHRDSSDPRLGNVERPSKLIFVKGKETTVMDLIYFVLPEWITFLFNYVYTWRGLNQSMAFCVGLGGYEALALACRGIHLCLLCIETTSCPALVRWH